MKRHKHLAKIALGACSVSILVGACAGTGNGSTSADATDLTPVPLGRHLAGLSASETAEFEAGLEAFAETEDAGDGLGPVFNSTSCGNCHASGAVGGAATNTSEALVTRIGGLVSGKYSDLESFGGPVLQSRSLREFDGSYPVEPEVVPPEATFVSHRITTPLFGAGLIEAIPDSEILSKATLQQLDGVHGVPNRVLNLLTGKIEIGRFGWKAQHSDLNSFAADAYLNEMGVTSDLFPHENLPQGQPIPNGADTLADPEDQNGDVAKFATFMRFLAPPYRSDSTSIQVIQGEKLFHSIGCANCHTPFMTTGTNSSSALSNKIVRLYSDLLLHQMGGELADGIQQADAKGDQFRTAPLWGLSLRTFLLHDGRARTVSDAIFSHAGEATKARDSFNELSEQNRIALLAFLGTL